MPDRRSPWRWVLVGATIVVGIAATWTTTVRATIPLALDDRIEDTYARNRNSGGAEVYFVELTDGRRLLVDRYVAESLEDASSVRKARWSWTLTADDAVDYPLWRTRELPRMAALTLALVGLVLLLALGREKVDDVLRTVLRPRSRSPGHSQL